MSSPEREGEALKGDEKRREAMETANRIAREWFKAHNAGTKWTQTDLERLAETILLARLSPAKAAWSKEIPTKEGLYRVRLKGIEERGIWGDRNAAVVYLADSGLCAKVTDGEPPAPVSELGYLEWSGPIPVPEE